MGVGGKVAVARGPGKFDNQGVLGQNLYRFEALGEIYKSRRVPEPETLKKITFSQLSQSFEAKNLEKLTFPKAFPKFRGQKLGKPNFSTDFPKVSWPAGRSPWVLLLGPRVALGMGW